MTAVLMFALKNWKAILGVLAGFTLAWWIQGLRVDRMALEVKTLKTNISACQDANKSNMEAIRGLQNELKAAGDMCSSRLRGKDTTIERLKQIDNLKPKGVSGEKANNSDSILNELNGLFKPSSKN